jgi:hypothetical protein
VRQERSQNHGQTAGREPMRLNGEHEVSINGILEYPMFAKNIWVNYNDLTATSLEIIVSKGNHPQMGLIQVSEIL